jgi:hypothetical protein
MLVAYYISKRIEQGMFLAQGESMKVTLLPMVRILLFQSLLTMLLALPFVNAEASISTVSQRVSTYVFEGEELDLLEELNLNSKKVKIEQVKIKVQATNFISRVQVLLNNNIVKTVKVKSSNKSLYINIPKSVKVNSLTLKADAVFVNKVSASVRKKSANKSKTIKIIVKQKIIGSEKINLMKLMTMANININSHHTVQSVSIKSRGRGLISVSAGNSHEGSVLVRRKQTTQLIKTDALENELGDIELLVNGQVSVKSVTVKLKPLEAPM